MITLDCSNYITDISGKREEELTDLYLEIHRDIRERLEERFLDKTFTIEDYQYHSRVKSYSV